MNQKNIEITSILTLQKNYFLQGATKSIEFRINALKKLKQLLTDNQEAIIAAINKDLNRDPLDIYMSELFILINEINYAINNIYTWSKSKSTKTPFFLFPSKSLIQPEPYGVVLIIAPWNFPLQLLITPLIGAIAAGNCAIIKPSEFSIHTTALIKKLFDQAFNAAFIYALEANAEESHFLIYQRFDYIFFTGSTNVGTLIMQAAAQNLTPMTLELGGNNPCIIDKTANIKNAAEKAAWGKFFNAGQNCLAPNFLFVNNEIYDTFLKALLKNIEKMYTTPAFFPKIINAMHAERLKKFLSMQKIIYSSFEIDEKLILGPTITEATLDEALAMPEIFGPILPIVRYTSIDEIISRLHQKEKSLAIYLFANDKVIQQKIDAISAGSYCINDMLIQASSPHLPFGGVGKSGFGKYHGKYSFDTFSHYKSIVKSQTSLNNSCIISNNFLKKILIRIMQMLT